MPNGRAEISDKYWILPYEGERLGLYSYSPDDPKFLYLQKHPLNADNSSAFTGFNSTWMKATKSGELTHKTDMSVLDPVIYAPNGHTWLENSTMTLFSKRPNL